MQAREDEEKPQKIGAFGAAYWPYDKKKNQKCIYIALFQLLASRLKFSFTRLSISRKSTSNNTLKQTYNNSSQVGQFRASVQHVNMSNTEPSPSSADGFISVCRAKGKRRGQKASERKVHSKSEPVGTEERASAEVEFDSDKLIR